MKIRSMTNHKNNRAVSKDLFKLNLNIMFDWKPDFLRKISSKHIFKKSSFFPLFLSHVSVVNREFKNMYFFRFFRLVKIIIND